MSKIIEQRKQQFLAACKTEGITSPVRRGTIKEIRNKYNLPMPLWLVDDPTRKVAHGLYSLPELELTKENIVTPATTTLVQSDATMNFARSVEVLTQEVDDLVPPLNTNYVPYGNYKDVERIVKERRFLPVYISGLSGNGKTTMVEHICAKNKREYIRASIAKKTDEDDLLGGFRLINGESVWADGPVVIAMRRGAILLLDEVNLNQDSIMCLQPVLEGKPVYLKKINQVVHPAPGFNVIATANGKGQGGEDGYEKFVGAMVMNEAFLERFAYCFEHTYPTPAIEKKIILNYMNREDCVDEGFADILVRWADTIRKTFFDGGCDDIITTRRLEHIVVLYGIFKKDRAGAVERGCGRFNDETRKSFIDLYEKLDGGEVEADPDASETVSADSTSAPF